MRRRLGITSYGFGLFVTEVFALCWPVVLNGGHALVFFDTNAYLATGQTAFSKGRQMLTHPAPGTHGDSAFAAAIHNARAVRSVFYSVFAYITADLLSLLLTIVFQAVIVALVLRLLFGLLLPGRPEWQRTVFIASLGLLTSVSWLTATAMPDVFTPIALLCAIIVMLFWARLSLATRAMLFLTIAGSLAAHVSNPPIVIGMLCIGGLCGLRHIVREAPRYGFVGGAIAVSLAATLAVSVVGFKQWTLTPNQPPFLLARSIVDGPGKLYLQEHCPESGLVMCRHMDKFNVNDDDFLWHANGVYLAVPLEEAAELRAEDKRFFIAAAEDHPGVQFAAIVRNTVRQLVFFTLQDFFVHSSVAVRPPGTVAPDDSFPAGLTRPYGYKDPSANAIDVHLQPIAPMWKTLLAIPEYCVVLASFGFLVWAALRGLMTSQEKRFCAWVIAAILANTLVTELSATAARYEARVIWLIPMAALAVAFAHYEFFLRREMPAAGESVNSSIN